MRLRSSSLFWIMGCLTALSASAQGALHITTTSLPDGFTGAAYAQALAAAGGKTPFTWSVSLGQLPDGLSLSGAGTISGTPDTPGVGVFVVEVKDANGNTAAQPFTIRVHPGVTIGTSSLTPAVLGVDYSVNLAASGGTPPLQWNVSAGTLPLGISLSPGGTLSGKPTAAGSYSFTVEVQDSSGATDTQPLTLAVKGAVTITTTSLPPGSLGTAYSQTLSASGGSGAYVWSISAGSLPAGLTLSGTGTISGTPTSPGTSNFTVQVSSAGASSTKPLSITIGSSLSISTVSLPSGAVGTAYNQTIAAQGGTPPFSWFVTGGSLPNGLALQGSTGVLSGTPGTSGSFTFTVTVRDSTSAAAAKQFTIVIGTNLQVATSPTLPGATAGAAYNVTLQASGGQAPYTWTIVSGSLPAGLGLNATTGTISGTPSGSGVASFTVQVTDAARNSATQAMSISIGVPNLPAISIAGFSGTMQPLQQPAVSIKLSNGYPIPITGTLTLTFTPSGSNSINDPSVQFSTGGRTASFTIPANSMQATFGASTLAIQTGSVEGSITLAVTALQANGSAIPIPSGLTQTVQLAAAPPSITSVSVTPVAGGFTVQISAVADTRDLTQATVTFQAASGTTLQSSQVTVPLSSAASAWFASSSAASYGGQFTLTLPFTISGNVSLSSVSVVLSSSAGNSAPASANY